MRRFAMAMVVTATTLSATAVQAGVLVPVPQVPGSLETDVYSIDTSDVLTGTYQDQGGREHGFVGTLDGQYRFFDYGKNNSTIGQYINDDGVVAGWASQPQPPWYEFQFVRDPDGTVTPLTLNGRRLKGEGRPGGLTNSGVLAGEYQAERKDGSFHRAQSYLGTGTDYSSRIVLPFKRVHGTYATGVNNNGDVVGYYSPCGECGEHGFVIHDGVVTDVVYPAVEVISTELVAMNDSGMAVGWWSDSQDDRFHFLFDISTGAFKQLKVEVARGISNNGLVAVKVDGAPYIYCLTKENCPTSPGAISVNDKWFRAKPGSLHTALCSHDCRKSLNPRS